MCDKPLTSMIIPVYNVSTYIERCARSIFEQTYQNWEAIFVDDCSPDNSVQVLESVLHDYPKLTDRIRILHHGHNRGLAAARNTGIDAAKGEFVMHVDSDDWLESSALELLVKKQQETGADIVSANAIRHTRKGNDLLKEPEYTNSYEMTLKMIELTIDHVIWRRLIRLSLYINNNIHAVEGVDIGEDHHTLPRLSYYAKKVERVDSVVYHYNCVNENSIMSQSNRRSFNFRKYSNDRDSCIILLDFFHFRNSAIEKHVQETFLKYLNEQRTNAVNLNDWNAFSLVCKDIGKNYIKIEIIAQFIILRMNYIVNFIVHDFIRNNLYHKIRKLKT